jgi:hypothetical protein
MKNRFLILTLSAMLTQSFSAYPQNRPATAGEQTSVKAEPEMSVSDNKLTLKNAPVGKFVVIYSIIGNKLRQIEIKSPDEEHELKLPRAIYIFKMDGKVKKFVVK